MMFLQAVINPNGPAFRCFELVESRQVNLLVCPAIIAEVHDVLNRSVLQSRFRRLTPEKVDQFLSRVLVMSEQRPNPPQYFKLPRDPDDESYLNLALDCQASHLVTWNQRHLTYLMESSAPEAIEFRSRYPDLTILDPPAFLNAIAPKSTS